MARKRAVQKLRSDDAARLEFLSTRIEELGGNITQAKTNLCYDRSGPLQKLVAEREAEIAVLERQRMTLQIKIGLPVSLTPTEKKKSMASGVRHMFDHIPGVRGGARY